MVPDVFLMVLLVTLMFLMVPDGFLVVLNCVLDVPDGFCQSIRKMVARVASHRTSQDPSVQKPVFAYQTQQFLPKLSPSVQVFK